MADTLLRLRIAVDGSAVIPDTMAQASSAVARHTTFMTNQFREASAAGTAMSTDISWGLSQIEPAAEHAEYSMVQAKEAVRGLGEQIGVHLPRMLSNFLAEVPQIGSVMSAAFSGLAVISLIQVLGELPAAFEKISGAITGWDETAQKAYQHQIDINQKYIDQLRETERATKDLALVGKTGSEEKTIALQIERGEVAKLQAELQSNQKNLAMEMERLNELQKQSAAGWQMMESLNPMGLLVNHVKGVSAEIDDLQKRIEKATEKNIELDLAIKKAQGVTVPKAGAELTAEEIKEAKAAADKKEQIERDYRAAQAAIYREHVIEAGKQVDEELATEKRFKEARAEQDLAQQQRDIEALDEVNRQYYADQRRLMEENNRLLDKARNDEIQEAMNRGEKARQAEQQRIRQQHAEEEAEYRRQAAALRQIDSLFNQHVMAWVTGQQTIKQAMEQSWNAIATNAISNLVKMGEQQLISSLLHKSLAKEGILVDAKAAAAHAFTAVMKALPFPADVILAPIAAAGAFAGVAAFGSFDQGGIVPNTGMHMLHKKEMVLDPMLSSGLQQMIMNGGARQSVRGGDINLNYNAHGAGSREDHTANARHIVSIIKREQRRGALPSL